MSEIQISQIDESEIDTVLADDIDFEGTLSFKKNLMIKGRFKGDIKATTLVELRTPARVEGTIETPTLKVEEKVIFNGEIKMPSGDAGVNLRDTAEKKKPS